jgi:hypothetical protein
MAASSSDGDGRGRHVEAARSLFAHLFSDMAVADTYRLSAAEAERRGHTDKRTNDIDLTYGDVRFDTIAAAINAVEPKRGDCFVDLGSGVGRGVLAAACLFPFSLCAGVELLQDLHTAALEPARRFMEVRASIDAGQAKLGKADLEHLDGNEMASGVELLNGDLYEQELEPLCSSSAGAGVLVFVCCVTWSADLMQRLAEKVGQELHSIDGGASIVTVGQRMPQMVDLAGNKGAVLFEETARFHDAFEWGREAIIVHRVVKVGVLMARRYRKQRGAAR